MKPERPVLMYHGAKWAMADWMLSVLPKHRVYTEVFGGGGSVLMKKSPSDIEVYNDLWSEIVNVFRVLRDPVQSELLKERLYLTPFAREELILSVAQTDDLVEQARRTLVRSWMEFSSRAFANAKTVSFAASAMITNGSNKRIDGWIGWQECIPSFTRRLRGVIIEHLDANDVLRKYDDIDTLHYADPPYVKETRTSTSDGYAHELTDAGHVVLSETLHSLRGMVVLSGYESDLYSELYNDWHVMKHDVGDSSNNRRTEVLWLNPACYKAQAQRNLFDAMPTDETHEVETVVSEPKPQQIIRSQPSLFDFF